MMFVAGGLIWANVTKREWIAGYYVYGWPDVVFYDFRGNSLSDTYQSHIEYKSIIINFVIAANILWLVWTFCEWLIRRRAARKGA